MKKRIADFFRKNYLLFFSLYFGSIFLKSTSFIVDYPILNIIEKSIRLLSLLLLTIRILVILYDNRRGIITFIKKKSNYLKIFLIVFVLLVFLINLLITKNIKLTSLLIICIASYGYDYKKVIKAMLIMQMVGLVFTIIGCVSGLTQDYIILRSDGTIRHSFGFTYTTVLSQTVLFASLLFIYINSFKINIKSIIVLEIINILAYIFTTSRTELLIFELVVFCILLSKIINFKKIMISIGMKLSYFFILLPIISILLVIIYPMGGVMNKIDDMLSGRLMIQSNVLRNEKLTPFGSNFKMVGYGLEDATKYGGSINYNYIDNEYIQLLVIDGIIIFILVILLIVCLLKELYAKKKYKEFVFVYIYLLYAIVNPRLLEILYSPIPLIVFYELINSVKFKEEGHPNENK